MNVVVALIVAIVVLGFGLIFAFFPVWGIRMVCRCARAYMKEDLSTDPAQVAAFRFYGLAAAGLGLYAVYQILGGF